MCFELSLAYSLLSKLEIGRCITNGGILMIESGYQVLHQRWYPVQSACSQELSLYKLILGCGLQSFFQLYRTFSVCELGVLGDLDQERPYMVQPGM